MGKLSSALGFSLPNDIGEMDEGDASDVGPASEKPEKAKGGGSAEVMAMKMFTSASTPEAKVAAFKALLESCGVLDDSGY